MLRQKALIGQRSAIHESLEVLRRPCEDRIGRLVRLESG